MQVHDSVRTNDILIELVEWDDPIPPDEKYQVVLSDRDCCGLLVLQHPEADKARLLFNGFVELIETAVLVPLDDPLIEHLDEDSLIWTDDESALVALDDIPAAKRLLYKLRY